MSLYRVLFVDHETEKRDEFIRKIDWADCGFELVAKAENGQQALELAQSINPDLVITDIRLPLINGLALCKRLSKQMPSVKLIILSSSGDFESAQQAIKMNVVQYFLKPVSATELMSVLRKLKLRMDRKVSKMQDDQMLREHYTQTLPIVKNQFLVRLIEGRVRSEDLIKQATQYELDLTSKNWAAAVVRIDEKKLNQVLDSKELELMSAKNLLDENLIKFCRINSFISGDYVVIIAMLDAEYMIHDFVDKMNRICKISNYFLRFGLSAGVGLTCDKLENLNQSYIGALSALDYRVFKDANQAIYIGDMNFDNISPLKFDEQDEYELLGAVKLGSGEDIKNTVDQIFHRFGTSMLPFSHYQIFIFEMMSVLINLVRNYKLNIYEIFPDGLKGYLNLSDFDSLQSLNNWVYESCLNINMLIKRERMSTTKLTVEKAKQFVNEHYNDSEISVEMLCDYLHMSPAYFSTIFKRESGMNFVDYLTTVRLEQAVKLLNSTGKKFSSICALVGYTDPNYFSYVFKKHYGISPSKYKAK